MILEARNLYKALGGVSIINDVNIELKPGEVKGLLGVNGAGKTTLLRMLSGLLKPDSGKISIYHASAKTIGAIIEKPAVYEYLSAQENLKLMASIQGAPSDRESVRGYLQQVGLSPDRKDQVAHFSMGMKQRLGIAIALLNSPGCLLLDEPFSGLDPLGSSKLRSLILQLAREKGIAILISSHLIDQLVQVCDRLYVLHQGKFVTEGSTAEVMHRSVSHYRLEGQGLENSLLLQKLGARFNPSGAEVIVEPVQVPGLIRDLIAEGCELRLVQPYFHVENLFQGA